jgi:hypothetical protein
MRDAGLLGGVRDVSQVPILGMGLPTSPPGGGEDGGPPGEGPRIPPLAAAAARAASYRTRLYESSTPREENPAASFFSAFDELQIKFDTTYDKHHTYIYTQGVPGGKVNILGGHNIGHSKPKTLYEHVSYSKRFPR